MKRARNKQCVGIGVVGAGYRVRGIVQRLVEIAAEGMVRVEAAYDPEPQAMEKLGSQIGYEVRAGESDVAVIQDPAVDWVFIGSWNVAHARQAILALEAGKDVFCEKPLATTIADCVAIRDAHEKSERMFAFGLTLRYSPFYRKIHEVLRSGRLGEIISFEFNETLPFNHGGYIFGHWRRTRADSGGHLLEKCCHDLDLANWFVESLPRRVASFGGRRFYVPENRKRVAEIGTGPRGFEAYSDWKRHSPHLQDPFAEGADIVDHQVAILEYENGVKAVFHTNCNAAIPERRFSICGSRAGLRADLLSEKIEIADIGWTESPEVLAYEPMTVHGGGDEVLVSSLLRAMTKGDRPDASIQEGLISAISALAIDEAMLGNKIVDLTPYWKEAKLGQLD